MYYIYYNNILHDNHTPLCWSLIFVNYIISLSTLKLIYFFSKIPIVEPTISLWCPNLTAYNKKSLNWY